MTGFGNSLEEITKELEECENLINALAVDGNKARNLLRAGKELMLEHPFTRESLGNVRKQHASNSSEINYLKSLFQMSILGWFLIFWRSRIQLFGAEGADQSARFDV